MLHHPCSSTAPAAAPPPQQHRPCTTTTPAAAQPLQQHQNSTSGTQVLAFLFFCELLLLIKGITAAAECSVMQLTCICCGPHLVQVAARKRTAAGRHVVSHPQRQTPRLLTHLQTTPAALTHLQTTPAALAHLQTTAAATCEIVVRDVDRQLAHAAQGAVVPALHGVCLPLCMYEEQ